MSQFSGEYVSSAPAAPLNATYGRDIVEQSGTLTNTQILNKFKKLFRDFEKDGIPIYQNQITGGYEKGRYHVQLDLTDLHFYDPELHSMLKESPSTILPLIEAAAREIALDVIIPRPDPSKLPSYQVTFHNLTQVTDLRKVDANDITKLLSLRGIVTSASKPRIKAVNICIMCRGCHNIKRIKGATGFGSVAMPRTCDAGAASGIAGGRKCPIDPYIILSHDCEYIDVQTLKLQELPESVPTGEMPRHVTLSCERYLVGEVKPGTRMNVIGIHMTYTAKQSSHERKNGVNDIGIRVPYLRVLGLQKADTSNNLSLEQLTLEDQNEIITMVNESVNIYEDIAKSIAPAIMGRDDIKKAIACSLFGGSRKVTPDGMRLRGDINILLLGDPSVAKSQFLKFAAQAAPISVYTSGKGSSAAGLTAAVVRNSGTGEFALEGGALVLADGGVVCIDEFDKMRDQDRVAIHEAMEQQTISVAKAGITTILNSRTAVIAAANPVFGRYDDTKTATDNIDFQATILSRFDLIFIIRDLQDADMDYALASHIIDVHTQKEDLLSLQNEDIIPIEKLKKYITYARQIQPRLSDEAAVELLNAYVGFRSNMRKAKLEGGNTTADVIPITVRQLEAIIRLTEALARMHLSPVATTEHVAEALRLFNVATIQAASTPMGEIINSPQFARQLANAEKWYESKIPVGTTVSTRRIIQDIVAAGHSENAAKKALERLVNTKAFKFVKQRKAVQRVLGSDDVE